MKRYQEVIGPYARWLRVGGGDRALADRRAPRPSASGRTGSSSATARRSPTTDPQFHRNVAYFVFTLPFEQFLVHWALVALVVVLLVTVLSHYLNGGIRVQGSRPRVRPAVKAHISVILGLMALVKAVGYYLARFNLDLSTNGYIQGAGYTDVHARLPALRAADPGVAGRRRPADLQHPPAGLGPARPRGRAVVPRGPDRRHHLPGRRAGLQGQPGPEHAGAPVHPAEHQRHPGGHGPQRHTRPFRTRRRRPSTPPS